MTLTEPPEEDTGYTTMNYHQNMYVVAGTTYSIQVEGYMTNSRQLYSELGAGTAE